VDNAVDNLFAGHIIIVMENITNIALVAVVVGVVQAVKIATDLNSKYVPVVSIVFGIVGVGLFAGFGFNSALLGIITGLSSCGLYSSVKSVATK